MVRLSHRMVQSTWVIILISLFSVACSVLADVPKLIYTTPTDTPTPYPTYTPAPAQIIEIEVTPTPGPWLCLKGKFQISNEAGGEWLIGEKLLCASEWKISNLYGPDLDTWDKPIYFSDFIPQE